MLKKLKRKLIMAMFDVNSLEAEVQAELAADKCRERAFFAKNKKFVDLWHDIADNIEAKYLSGQPWLRTYDGKFE